jgi:5-methylcytosine-specific restriction endonuclease McrA
MQKGNAMQRVLVVDKNRNPLMPCHPARARELLKTGKAAVLRRYPFTIILKEREGGETQEIQMKLDPGAKTTGIALVGSFQGGLRCIWAAELTHRGFDIRDNLLKRRMVRRNRRNRKTRYRPARFLNRLKPTGWLAPSLLSRLNNISTWFKRLSKFSPISHLAMELVKFDTQAMQNPEISGVEYQQGELMGYEVREYLLEKWGRKCAYCGKEGVPLEVEHIVPKSRGGSNRVANLTLACRSCNEKKGNKTADEFGHPNIQAIAQQPLATAATMNTIRWVLLELLRTAGLPVEVGTGGRTKFNRSKQDYPKAHWIDAACVGQSGEVILVQMSIIPLRIFAKGRQSRQMTANNKYGFPKTNSKQHRVMSGFQSGDVVKASKLDGKYKGVYTGRISITGNRCEIVHGSNKIKFNPIHCKPIHRLDGYKYG